MWYARIPDHPDGAIAMDVFIAVDEILHEVLHLLFLANELRLVGGLALYQRRAVLRAHTRREAAVLLEIALEFLGIDAFGSASSPGEASGQVPLQVVQRHAGSLRPAALRRAAPGRAAGCRPAR